jgi:hypothetical protein
MTREEHLLMIFVMTKQAQFVKFVGELLKNQGIASGDDLSAFDFAMTRDVSSNAALLEQAKTAYLYLAKEAGVTTGLEIP